MKINIVDVLRENTKKLMVLRDIPSGNALSKAAGVDQKTISNLLADNTLPNPTLKVIQKIAVSLKVEPWMIIIPDFPFESLKGKNLQTISPLTYSSMRAIESQPDGVKLLLLEAMAGSLNSIDDNARRQIKEAQGDYLGKRKRI